jgi:hypothetical protein
MLAKTSDCGEHKRFVKRQLMPLYGNVGFIGKSTEGSLVPRLRKEMVKTTCQLGYPDCVERSAQLFREWRNSKCKKKISKQNLKIIFFNTWMKLGIYRKSSHVVGLRSYIYVLLLPLPIVSNAIVKTKSV